MLAPVRGGNKTEKSERTSSRSPGPSGTVSAGPGGSGVRGPGAPRDGDGDRDRAGPAAPRGKASAIWGGWPSPGQLWGRGETGGGEVTREMANTGLLGPGEVGTFHTGWGYTRVLTTGYGTFITA